MIYHRTHIDARLYHEALEALDALLQQAFEIPCIAGYDSAPKPDVTVDADVARLVPLHVQVRYRGRRGNRVERHVNECRDSSRDRGEGPRLEALPCCSTGLIQVDVTAVR